MIFLVRERGAENIEKKKKTDRRQTFKIEEKEKRRIQESQQTTINIFGFTFYTKDMFCSKI